MQWGDTAYAAEKLLAMHQAFETVYGEGYVDEEYGMVMMPAVVCGRDSGIRTLALVTLDLESFGEHFGTIFMTPGGLLEQGSSSLSEKTETGTGRVLYPIRLLVHAACGKGPSCGFYTDAGRGGRHPQDGGRTAGGRGRLSI